MRKHTKPDVPHGTGNVRDSDRLLLTDDVVTRPIPGIPGYLAGDDGRVYSTRTDPPSAMYGRPRKDTRNGVGDVRIRIKVDGRLRDQYAYVLVAKAWLPERPDGARIIFLDGDSSNSRPENMVWGHGMSVIDLPAFVRVWQLADTIHEVCEEMGIPYHRATTLAKRLRDKGVPLKQLARAIDYGELSEIAADLLGTEDE